jgi:hypothetical protein
MTRPATLDLWGHHLAKFPLMAVHCHRSQTKPRQEAEQIILCAAANTPSLQPTAPLPTLRTPSLHSHPTAMLPTDSCRHRPCQASCLTSRQLLHHRPALSPPLWLASLHPDQPLRRRALQSQPACTSRFHCRDVFFVLWCFVVFDVSGSLRS